MQRFVYMFLELGRGLETNQTVALDFFTIETKKQYGRGRYKAKLFQQCLICFVVGGDVSLQQMDIG